MKIPLRDGSEAEIDPVWIRTWCELYWADDVMTQLNKARLWCLSNPDRRKVRIRSFLNNWLSNAHKRGECRIRPRTTMVVMPEEPRPDVPRETVSEALQKMKGLLCG